MKHILERFPLLFPAVLAATAAVSCQELPTHPGAKVHVVEQGRLQEVNPNDVAIPPVVLAEEGMEVPEEMLRVAFQRALVKRRYSPLSLEYVDSGVVEASYRPGAVEEDAVCQLIVHAWDSTLWASRSALDVDLELRMIDPADPEGPALFAARLPGRFEFGAHDLRYATDMARLQAALDELAYEIASTMPAHDTGPGTL